MYFDKGDRLTTLFVSMNPLVYYSIHIFGVILVFLSYGMLIARGMLESDNKPLRKFGGIASGIGLFLILLGGFGLLARVYNNTWPTFVIIKLVVWVLLGGMIALINRKPKMGKVWYALTLLLGLIAIYSGYFKPGGL